MSAGSTSSTSAPARCSSRTSFSRHASSSAAAELLAWREKLVRELQRAGALVLDVLPADITPHLVRRYLDVKVRHLL